MLEFSTQREQGLDPMNSPLLHKESETIKLFDTSKLDGQENYKW